jgi:inorganic pyrophosphatase
MKSDLTTLPTRSRRGGFHVVVESPAGSAVKLKYDPELGHFKLARALVAGLRYPYDWGFVPGTKAPDGDPLDAMIFCDTPTYPGVIVECRALGLIRLKQNRKRASGQERNDRLIAIPVKAERYSHIQTHFDLPLRWRQELEEFFLYAIRFENKDAKILGWATAVAAERMVDRCAHDCSGLK